MNNPTRYIIKNQPGCDASVAASYNTGLGVANALKYAKLNAKFYGGDVYAQYPNMDSDVLIEPSNKKG